MDLNPQHPVWYRGMLSYREYWSGNYRAAVDDSCSRQRTVNWANNSRRQRLFEL